MEPYTDRAATADDAPWIVAVHEAPHARPYVHAPTVERVREALGEKHIAHRIVLDASGRAVGLWIAIVHDDGWLVELARIVADPPRRGIGRWALRRALWWAFDQVGAHRVYLEVTASNESAWRLYESEGFVREATFRDGYRQTPGRFEDLFGYGLLRSEWAR